MNMKKKQSENRKLYSYNIHWHRTSNNDQSIPWIQNRCTDQIGGHWCVMCAQCATIHINTLVKIYNFVLFFFLLVQSLFKWPITAANGIFILSRWWCMVPMQSHDLDHAHFLMNQNPLTCYLYRAYSMRIAEKKISILNLRSRQKQWLCESRYSNWPFGYILFYPFNKSRQNCPNEWAEKGEKREINTKLYALVIRSAIFKI